MSETHSTDTAHAGEGQFDLDHRQRLQLFAGILVLVFLVVIAVAFL